MKRYQIYCDGNLIADNFTRDLMYLNGRLEQGENEAETLNFKLPASNPYREKIVPLGSTISLYENYKMKWQGRPMVVSYDMLNDMSISCEGVIAWLIDIIIPSYTVRNQSYSYYIEEMLNRYNQYASSNRRISLGSVSSGTLSAQISTSYIKASELFKIFLKRVSGAFYITYDTNGTPLMNFRTSIKKASQSVRYSLNLLDLTRSIDPSNIITAVWAKGDGIAAVEVINKEAAKTFGKIYTEQTFAGTSKTEVENMATSFLEQNILGDSTMVVKAIDLSAIDKSEVAFDIGDTVNVVSAPHGVNTTMKITHISVDLNDASRSTLTLGKSLRTFTGIVNKMAQ